MNTILYEDFTHLASLIGQERFELLQGKKWLITGATGMIGSYFLSFLCFVNESYLQNSMHITVLHRGEIDAKNSNIGYLLGKPYLDFQQVDLSTIFEISALDAYNYIIHGASNAAPRTYLADRLDTINTNVRATQIFLDAVKESKALDCFLYISSGEVYGEPDIDHVPTSETYVAQVNHLAERSCYNEAKRFAESLCWNYFRQYGAPIKIIRPVHIFGPGFRKNDSRVWADFIVQAIEFQVINILSDGLARRGFCYLSDAVLQIVAVLFHGIVGEAYNIGAEKHVSILDLAHIIAEESEKPTTVTIKNQLPSYLQGSPKISCPSIQKVAQLMPLVHTDLSEGIRKTIKWFLSTK